LAYYLLRYYIYIELFKLNPVMLEWKIKAINSIYDSRYGSS